MAKVSWREVILVGLVIATIIGVYYFFLAPTPPGAPVWSFEGWYQNDVLVEEAALVGQPVTLKLKVTGVAPISAGSLKVEIKKDVRLWYDAPVHSEAFTIALAPGAEQLIETTFTPDEATDGVAEYYFKLYWNERAIYDPQTRGARHGLLVLERAPVSFEEAEFEGLGPE